MRPNLPARWGCAIGALVLALGLPSGVAAQRLTPDFPTFHLTLSHDGGPGSAAAALAFGHPDDYRWEGALVGGIGMGLFLAIGLAVFCTEMSEEAHPNCAPAAAGGLLIGGTAGVVVGGLLGGLFPKAKPNP